MNPKKTIFFACLILVSIHNSLGQTDEKVIRINKIVGDTVDRAEKLRFRVFPYVDNENYKFAVCLLKNDTMKLRVTYDNDITKDFPYSSELLLADIERIYNNQQVEYAEPKTSFRKAYITVTSNETEKSINLKKRKVVELKLKGQVSSSRIKISKVVSSGEVAILVKKESGNMQIIPMSEIEYIYKFKRYEYITFKAMGGIYFAIGAVATAINPAENYRLGSVFMAGGAVPFFFRNEKIWLDNSRVKVNYK
jgi:hypothetical protein